MDMFMKIGDKAYVNGIECEVVSVTWDNKERDNFIGLKVVNSDTGNINYFRERTFLEHKGFYLHIPL